jgi:hypothetical protein
MQMPSDTVMLVGAFIPIVAILFVGLIILVPIAGLTLRFALKPALEALGPLREQRNQDAELRLLEQRIALLEGQLVDAQLGQGRSRPQVRMAPDLAADEPR